jgi:hypothetical protein
VKNIAKRLIKRPLDWFRSPKASNAATQEMMQPQYYGPQQGMPQQYNGRDLEENA